MTSILTHFSRNHNESTWMRKEVVSGVSVIKGQMKKISLYRAKSSS
jgi:hypothetical protein